MQIHFHTLSNGLRLVYAYMPGVPSTTVTFWVGVGSRYEEEDKSGISHFLEHLPSKGTKKYKTAYQISHMTDSIGAESNAATSREWTQYYLKVRTGQIERAFDLISQQVIHPLVRSKDIQVERKVILEEISMKNDDPGDKIGDIFLNLTFSGSPLGLDIIGKRETVDVLKRIDILSYKEKYYDAQNSVLTVSGSVRWEDAKALAEKYFGDLAGNKRYMPDAFAVTQDAPRIHVEYKESEQAHFFLGFLGYPRGHVDRFAETLLSTILGRGMSSRLFTEIREKRGLAYSIGTSASRFIDIGIFATYAGVDLKRIDEALKITLYEHYALKNDKKKVTNEELAKAKEYIKGRTALALEDTSAVNDFIGQMALFLPEISTPEEVFEKIDKVTLSDILRVANAIFIPDHLNFAVIGPYKDKERFDKIIAKEV